MRVLVTGSLGFIGFSISHELLRKNYKVVGVDNLDKYYSKKLKLKRLEILKKYKNYSHHKIDITSKKNIKKLSKINFRYLFHFAAQAGVRYSLINPRKYFEVNVVGFQNILNLIKKNSLKKIIYASSSSVYGDQVKFPTLENNKLNAKNTYAKTKIINELTGEIYNKAHNIPVIGLRFFTVYGEWGRPDMFIIKFLNMNSKKKTFYLNKAGNHDRDFTYIKDVTKICTILMKKKIKNDHFIFNVCRGKTVNIKKITHKLKKLLPKSRVKNVKANKADVMKTHGSNRKIKKFINFKKFTDFNIGLSNTIEWYKKNKIYKLL